MKNVGDTARDNWPMIELAIKIWVFDKNVRAEERTIVMECSISFGNFLALILNMDFLHQNNSSN